MSTLKLHPPLYWRVKKAAAKKKSNNWNKLITFAHNDVDAESRLFKLSAVAELVLFLLLFILLIFGFHAPVGILVTITVLFSANFITGINGPGMRMVTSIFALGLLNLLMLAILFV